MLSCNLFEATGDEVVLVEKRRAFYNSKDYTKYCI
jgi:hypothetical protein